MDFIQALDITIFKWIHFYLKNDFFDYILPVLRNKLTWIPLYIYFIYHLYKVNNKNYWKIILSTIVLVCFSDIICAKVLKELIVRIRPCYLLHRESWFFDFGLCSSTYSFPSCHALNHTAIAVFLSCYFNKLGKSLLTLWVFCIGFSQIYVGVHYPTDILGGIIFGTFIALIARNLVGKF